ncbi:MAG: transcription elongation factor GreB [Deltaproteobacteria bacterium]|nr:transcription elongation factor GreB [Deltaproteobacteria bacterium]
MDRARKLTQKGYEKLHKEAEKLSRVERPRVVQGVSDAAAEGDRSENAEYIYGKKKLREIDKRLQYLARLLKGVEVVDPSTLSGDVVQFGSTVTLDIWDADDDDPQRKTWTIVGEGEADLKEGSISYLAPIAKALLGKKVGEQLHVLRPKGEADVEILHLSFAGTPFLKKES